MTRNSDWSFIPLLSSYTVTKSQTEERPQVEMPRGQEWRVSMAVQHWVQLYHTSKITVTSLNGDANIDISFG